MRVLFKTNYDQDIDFLVDRGERIRVLAVLLIALFAPVFFGSYILTELSFFLVYALAGIGLMVLMGLSGQISFGHGAFLGIGAYAHSIFVGYGIPFFVSLFMAAVIAGLFGAALGRATSKMHGFYLAIATLAFAIIMESVIGAWDDVTGGHMGMQVPDIIIFGYELAPGAPQYYLCLFFLIFFIWGTANLMRGSTGRAFIAIRDSETSAKSLGINVYNSKILAFFISGLITGIAGALLAHLFFYLSPESFGLNESLKLVLMVIVGGAASIHGVILGAAFVSFLPNITGAVRSFIPQGWVGAEGLELFLFGAIIAGFIIFEPDGLFGRWRKFRLWLDTFPYYKKATFTREKRYIKTERMR